MSPIANRTWNATPVYNYISSYQNKIKFASQGAFNVKLPGKFPRRVGGEVVTKALKVGWKLCRTLIPPLSWGGDGRNVDAVAKTDRIDKFHHRCKFINSF